jgi:hypothetical protein
MSTAGSSTPPTETTITEHELQQMRSGQRYGPSAGGVRAWSVVVAEQLGLVGSRRRDGWAKSRSSRSFRNSCTSADSPIGCRSSGSPRSP